MKIAEKIGAALVAVAGIVYLGWAPYHEQHSFLVGIVVVFAVMSL